MRDNESAIFYFDTGILFRGRRGCLLTTRGVYWANDLGHFHMEYADIDVRRTKVEEFRRIVLDPSLDSQIWLGEKISEEGQKKFLSFIVRATTIAQQDERAG